MVGYHKEVNNYSNPQVKFKNVPTGVEGKADAARMIRENRFAIAAVGDESEKCSNGSGGGPTTASPTTTTSTKTTTTTTSSAPTTTVSTETTATTTSGGDNYDNYDNYGDNNESFYHIGR